MTTDQNLDIIYYKRETIVIIPILNIYWQDIFIVRLSMICVSCMLANGWRPLGDKIPKGFSHL